MKKTIKIEELLEEGEVEKIVGDVKIVKLLDTKEIKNLLKKNNISKFEMYSQSISEFLGTVIIHDIKKYYDLLKTLNKKCIMDEYSPAATVRFFYGGWQFKYQGFCPHLLPNEEFNILMKLEKNG